jgi:hypothetical protein
VLLIGVGLSWTVRSAKVQREAVAAVERTGGMVGYASQNPWLPVTLQRPWAPSWLVHLSGVDFLTDSPWHDEATYALPGDAIAKRRDTQAAAWLTHHVMSISRPGDQRPLRVIAWKDPTLEPADPKLLAGYVITDTLWAAKALKLFEPVVAQELEESTQRLGWYGNGLHDVLFHPIDQIRHRPGDEDFVHGFSLGRYPTVDGRTIDLRVFRQTYDAKFDVGHPHLFAEHAVYHALFDFWQGRHEAARRRIREAIADRRTTDPQDRLFWDGQTGILVDFANYPDWLAFQDGKRAACRHFTFKLGVLLYAVRLLGMEQETGVILTGMKERLWSAQTESGGLAHFVELERDGKATTGMQPTGEATAIAILAEVVKVKGR